MEAQTFGVAMTDEMKTIARSISVPFRFDLTGANPVQEYDPRDFDKLVDNEYRNRAVVNERQ